MTRASRRSLALASLAALTGIVLLTVLAGPAFAQPSRSWSARLQSINESPSVITGGRGSFEMRLVNDGQSVEYRLNYAGLSSNVIMAHIHIAQPNINGGIVVWLCDVAGGPLDDPLGEAPLCEGTTSGEVEGTFDAGNVLAISSQGVAAMDFAKLLRAIREGVAYINVHSVNHPPGEIRGQLRPGSRGRDD